MNILLWKEDFPSDVMNLFLAEGGMATVISAEVGELTGARLPMYPYGPWPQVLLLTHHTEAKNHSFHDLCTFKQVHILKNRIFLLIWAHLEPPTGAQILFNSCVWSHTPSFMFWQEEQL